MKPIERRTLLVWTIAAVATVGVSSCSSSQSRNEKAAAVNAGLGQKALVFTHVTVIDATGAPAKPDMTVVIKGGRIAALGKTAKLDVPKNEHVVDATGKFLIPGLWDMHTHPWVGKNFLALFTTNGVTGVRVMHGELVDHKRRQEISAGELIGPRMVIASRTVDGPDPAGPLIAVSNEDEGRQVVRKVKKHGADLVKVFNAIPRDAYFAIADEAKKQGIPFAGHVPYLVSAAEASDAGQRSIEHCFFVSLACSSRSEEELKKKLKEAWRTSEGTIRLCADTDYSEQKGAALFARFVKNSTWVCPTLIVWHGLSFRDEEDLVNEPRLKYMPLFYKESWNPKNNVRVALATGERRADFRKVCEKNLAIVGAMGRAGVGLLAGTDTTAMAYCFPGFGLHDELALFVQAGLSPMQAIQTATYNPAKCLGKLDSMGTVEQGKIADLVLLEANPLEDISNTQKIAAVVVDGKIFDRTALQKMLAQVEASRLHQAAADGEIEQVKLLISEGADINARDQRGWTPALAALYGGELAVTDLLLEEGADTTTPHLVAYTGDLRGIKSLLEKDATVDSLEGLTLLHAAAAGGHADIVEFLIAEGFEATATTEDDETTPLYLAAISGHKEVAELLIANGADVNAEGKYAATPLHMAAVNGHRFIADLLIEAGAEVNAQKNNKWGETPLHYATWAGQKDVAGLLIARGANLNARDNEKSTPLHFAVNRGHKDVVEMLVKNGADVNAKDNRGRTPLWYAKDKDHNEIVELLRKHKAKE
jgi:ankyrin repeat protein